MRGRLGCPTGHAEGCLSVHAEGCPRSYGNSSSRTGPRELIQHEAAPARHAAPAPPRTFATGGRPAEGKPSLSFPFLLFDAHAAG